MVLERFKGWYTFDEAATRLSQTLSEPISEHDVIQLAAEGHITASWFLQNKHCHHAQLVTVSCDYPIRESIYLRSHQIFDTDGKAWGRMLTGIFALPVLLCPSWGWWLLTFIGKGGESGDFWGPYLVDKEDGSLWELYDHRSRGDFFGFPAKEDVVITRHDIETFERLASQSISDASASPHFHSQPSTGTSSQGQASPMREGITKTQILTAFDGLATKPDLSRAMADGPKWILDAKLLKGTRGRGGHESRWQPVIMATVLHERFRVPMGKLNQAFNTHKFLADWREEWEHYSTM